MSHNKEKEMSPEERRNNRFRNRGFNLSYRDHLLESEEIIKGRMVSLEYNPSSKQPVEISVEQKYAKSLEIDLNDELEIEVGGVPILAKVVNIRRVRWTSFQPNFFVQMQPGVLDQAPKTFIATLNDLDAEKKKNTKLDHPIFPNCLHFGCRKNRKENSIDCKTNDLGSAGYGISFHPCRFGHFVFNLKRKGS